MDKERFLYLLQQYITNNATWEEVGEFFDGLESPESEIILTDFLQERWKDLPLKTTYDVTPSVDLAWDKMWTRIQDLQDQPVKKD